MVDQVHSKGSSFHFSVISFLPRSYKCKYILIKFGSIYRVCIHVCTPPSIFVGKTIHQSIMIHSQTILDQSTKVHNLNGVMHWESFWNLNLEFVRLYPDSHPYLYTIHFFKDFLKHIFILEHKGTISEVIVFHLSLVCSFSVLSLLRSFWFSQRWMDSPLLTNRLLKFQRNPSSCFPKDAYPESA